MMKLPRLKVRGLSVQAQALKSIKLIIFDWDDVITLGSKEGYFACYHAALTDVGVHLGAAEQNRRILSKWGKAYQEEIRALLPEHPELVDKAIERYEKSFFGDVFMDQLRVIPGVPELLTRLSRNYKLAIATGQHPALLRERIMPKFNIPNLFCQIITSYDIVDLEKQKPNPFSVQEIMRREDIKPAEAVFVGDAKGDMQMAIAAEVRPIAVLSGHMTKDDAINLGIKDIIQNVTDLESVL